MSDEQRPLLGLERYVYPSEDGPQRCGEPIGAVAISGMQMFCNYPHGHEGLHGLIEFGVSRPTQIHPQQVYTSPSESFFGLNRNRSGDLRPFAKHPDRWLRLRRWVAEKVLRLDAEWLG